MHSVYLESSVRHPSCFLFSPDLTEDKFIDCKLENVSWHENKRHCHLDTQEENDVLIYLVSFLGSMAVLPGNIVSALFMEKLGRVKIIGDGLTHMLICIICFVSFNTDPYDWLNTLNTS